MNLFIVRHGESEGNVAKRFQTETEKLTHIGESQASVVARRFEHVAIARIVASPMTRARQTAQAIADIAHAPIHFDDRFKEIRRSSELMGKPHNDRQARKIERIIDMRRHDPTYHYSDEENNFDFIRRVSEGLHALEDYADDDNVVLVCHGHVIRVLFGLIVFGVEFSSREFELMIRRIYTKNTGITMAEYTPEYGWKLVAFNDHAHLLE